MHSGLISSDPTTLFLRPLPVSSALVFGLRLGGLAFGFVHRLAIMAQPTKSISTMFTTSPLTPTGPAWSSYDSPEPSFDGGDNLDGYDQKTALIAQQRDGHSFSHPPGVSIRNVDTKQLSWWRAGVRNVLLKSLVHESRILGAMQVRRTRTHSLMTNYTPYFFDRKNLERVCLINTSYIPLRSVHTHSS